MLILKFLSIPIAVMSLHGFAIADTLKASQANDGTYHVETVPSQEACGQLCNNDTENVCRGYVFYQSDASVAQGECRLNNGNSETSDFKIDEPEAINIEQVISDMNDYRGQYGLGPLRWNAQLAQAANVHAQDLAYHGILQHEGTDGSSHGERIKRQDYSFSIALENVAAGQQSWEAALQGWKDSPGHNENLLNADATEIGVALDFNANTRFATYWAMVLVAPLNAAY